MPIPGVRTQQVAQSCDRRLEQARAPAVEPIEQPRRARLGAIIEVQVRDDVPAGPERLDAQRRSTVV
jgi:hypothetical protein